MITAEQLLIRRLAHLLLKQRGGTYKSNERDARAMVERAKDEWRGQQ
ncbi:hypothetical protein [Streptomyces sp. NBC_00239]|nr:hypothetical protein [Streptomyces sp. NBC_00239]